MSPQTPADASPEPAINDLQEAAGNPNAPGGSFPSRFLHRLSGAQFGKSLFKEGGLFDRGVHATNVVGDLQGPGGYRLLGQFAREGFSNKDEALSPGKRIEIDRERAFRGQQK